MVPSLYRILSYRCPCGDDNKHFLPWWKWQQLYWQKEETTRTTNKNHWTIPLVDQIKLPTFLLLVSLPSFHQCSTLTIATWMAWFVTTHILSAFLPLTKSHVVARLLQSGANSNLQKCKVQERNEFELTEVQSAREERIRTYRSAKLNIISSLWILSV